MRFTLALAALALCASMAQAHAQSADTDASGPTLDEVCREWGQMGQLIMANRQAGTPMSRLMAMVSTREDDATTTFPTHVFRFVIMEAYNRARMSSQVMQERAADDYRDELTYGCYIFYS